MTVDELIYILKNESDIKLDLLHQLRELEQAGEDEEIQNEIRIQLDQICGIFHLLYKLDASLHNTINNLYLFPTTFGKLWKKKPTKQQLLLAPGAMQSLSDLINDRDWDLSFYRNWRHNLDLCGHCLKKDPVHHGCWMDPNGAMRNYYHQSNDLPPSLDDIWGEWSGQCCCLFVRNRPE